MSAPSTLPPIDDSPAAAARLQQLQVGLLFERSRATAWVSLAATALVAALLWGRIAPPALLYGWIGLRLALLALRLWMRHSYAPRRAPSAARWRRSYTGVLIADGLSWGGGVALMAPGLDPVLTVLLLASLITIVAVAGAIMAPYPTLHAGYGLAVLLPAALTQLLEGAEGGPHAMVGLFGGTGLLLFLALHLFEGRVGGRQVVEMLRLRLQLEEEARARSQALALAERHSAVKSQFLATMSHEMRTPLHGILGLAQQLRAPQSTATSRESTIRLIERSGEHLLGLINDVLDFAKIEAGRMRLNDEPFDLSAVIEEVTALAGGSAHSKSLALEVDTGALGPAGSWMRGDAVRVRQVLHNLLGNAIKFTERGHVRISAERDAASGRVRIAVEDSGMGIPPAQLETIFDAFQQAEGAFDRRYTGTGLGLTIARELARAMDGELSARSTPGTGSVFSFEAPLPPALPDTLPPSHEGEPAARTQQRLIGRVLVAEDNAVNALVVEAMLRQIGVESEIVADGAQAVDRWERLRPDLVLMDCQMPEMDGFSATRRIRERERYHGRAHVPIIALTANAFESDRERCLAVGMDEHLAKPFHEAQLRALLARYLPAAETAGTGATPLVLDLTV